MKKIIFLFILFCPTFLYACTPQVTVTSEVTVTSTPLPTETPIPTPTLHLAFIEIQEKVKSSGSRFTLNSADGLIYEGETPIPGLTVAPNGTMTLTINGEAVTLKSADVIFDDEDGVSIAGYEQDESGTWVEVAPTQEELWRANFEKWKLDPNNYEIHYDVDNNLVVLDPSTKEAVYWKNKWLLTFLRKVILNSGNCYETDWVGSLGGNSGPPKDREGFGKRFLSPLNDYFKRISKEPGYEGPNYMNTGANLDYLGGEGNCWIIEPRRLGENVNDLDLVLVLLRDKQAQSIYELAYGKNSGKPVVVEK